MNQKYKKNIARLFASALFVGIMAVSFVGAGSVLAVGTVGSTGTGTGGGTTSPTTGYTGTFCPTSTGTTTFNNLSDLLNFFTCFILRSIVPLLFALAILVFVWGTVKFIGSEQSAEKEEGKQFMLWGVIAFAVMFSVWGLVNLLGQTFHINNIIPQIK